EKPERSGAPAQPSPAGVGATAGALIGAGIAHATAALSGLRSAPAASPQTSAQPVSREPGPALGSAQAGPSGATWAAASSAPAANSAAVATASPGPGRWLTGWAGRPEERTTELEQPVVPDRPWRPAAPGRTPGDRDGYGIPIV